MQKQYEAIDQKFPRVQFRLKRYEYDEFDKISEASGYNSVNLIIQDLVRWIINPDLAPTPQGRKVFKFVNKILIKGFD